MKKGTFYVLQFNDFGTPALVLVNGWTDGELCYYNEMKLDKNLKRNLWVCIDPDTGRSLSYLGCADTLERCAKYVHDWELDKKLHEYKKTKDYVEYVKQFAELTNATE